MSIRQTLLHVPTFPDPAGDQLLEGGVAIAALLGSALTAQVPQLNSDPSSFRPMMGGFVADYMQVMAEIAADSEKNAGKACEKLTELCRRKKVALELRRGLTRLDMPVQEMVDLARLHDLTIFPAPGPEALDYRLVHAAIFQSGSPLLLLPAGRSLVRLGRVVVGWDFSREAARVLKDAIPLLALADEIHFVTVTDEKDIGATTTATDLEKFMRAHGLSFKHHRTQSRSAAIASCLFRSAEEIGADLLVMGAYGHSRLSEFILGGATLGVLNNPPLPLLLSH